MSNPGGDPPGIGDFCRRLHPVLVGSLTLHCGDRAVAEEIAQEALARAWERWAAVGAMASPEAWTFRVALNLTSSRFRRAAIERRASARLAARSTARDVVDESDRITVRAAVASLPERQRVVVVLRYFADLSVEDTAAAMGCASGTVKSLTSKAVDRLRLTIGEITTTEVADHA